MSGVQLGFDAASTDSAATGDLQATRKIGARFGIWRRSFWDLNRHGKLESFPDPDYATGTERTRDAGMIAGSYLMPCFARGCPSMDEQWDVFMEAGGEVLRGVDIVPGIDIEFPGGIAATGRSPGEVLELVVELIECAERSLGVPPLLYTGAGQWHDTDTGLGDPVSPAAARCPLWFKTAYVRKIHQPLYTGSVLRPYHTSSPLDPLGYYRIPRAWRSRGCWFQQHQGDVRPFGGMFQADADLFYILSAGDAGDPRIWWLQERLGVPATGTWDDATSKALAAFQLGDGLKPDDIVGILTFARLSWR